MSVANHLKAISEELKSLPHQLIAVSKNHPVQAILEAFDYGQLHFGENKVQEMVDKHQLLPKSIHWHMIGHLQRNKVKYIAPFVYMIHSVDTLKLLTEIQKEALKNDRIINCLLQVHVAQEETKFGLSWTELEELLSSEEFRNMDNICIKGIMAMASNTDNQQQIRSEFKEVKQHFDTYKTQFNALKNVDFQEISMGMSSDYKIALEEGSTYIRIGSAIFGNRN